MVLFYSGTGNSRFAANRIAENLEDEVMDLFSRIRSGEFTEIASGKPWVIVTPTYAWRIPRVVEEQLEKTDLKGSKDIYFVMTCGGDIGNAEKYLRKLCRKKSMKYNGVKAVVMPENYIAMFSAPAEPEAKEIIQKALPVIDEISETIRSGSALQEPVNIKGRIESSVINPVFYAMSVKDRPFTVSDSCTGCGLCESLCPMNNIAIREGKPIWKGNCTHCMACICNCPQEAIEYGKVSVGKPRYKCPY